MMMMIQKYLNLFENDKKTWKILPRSQTNDNVNDVEWMMMMTSKWMKKKIWLFFYFFLFKMFVMFLWLANNPICAYDIMFSVSLCMERENILFFPVHQHNVVIKCLDDFFWLLCDDVQTHWETETKELNDWLNIFRNEKKVKPRVQ